MKKKLIAVIGAAALLAGGFAYLKSDTGAEILQKIQGDSRLEEGLAELDSGELRTDSGSGTEEKLSGEDLTGETLTSEASAAGTGSINTGDSGTGALQPEFAETVTDGFTVQQKEELEAIIGKVLEEKLTAALSENLNAMLEDGRLSSAVENYAAVQSSLVNVNTADESELTRLTGIGEARAKAIVAYRTEHGNFSSLEELTNISGISSGILEKFRDQATL